MQSSEGLQTADCRLQIGDCRLQIADCRSARSAFRLPPSPFCLPRSLFPLPPSAFIVLCWMWLLSIPAGLLPGGVAGGDEVLDARRRQIETMTPAEKQQLLRLVERFGRLDTAEQQRLRRLHEQLDRDRDSARLRRVMQGYHEWLQTLSPLVRAELRGLEPAERIKRIKRMRAEEAKTVRPNLEDIEGVRRWMEQYVRKQGFRLLAALGEQRRQEILRLPEATRRRMVVWEIWQRWQSGKSGIWPPLGQGDLDALLGQLSQTTRKRLGSKTPAEQRRIIGGWIRHARQHFASRHFTGPLPPVNEKELSLFFEKKLTDQQRDRLLSLPGAEMQRALHKMYLERNKAVKSPSHRPAGPPRIKRSGPPGVKGGRRKAEGGD